MVDSNFLSRRACASALYRKEKTLQLGEAMTACLPPYPSEPTRLPGGGGTTHGGVLPARPATARAISIAPWHQAPTYARPPRPFGFIVEGGNNRPCDTLPRIGYRLTMVRT